MFEINEPPGGLNRRLIELIWELIMFPLRLNVSLGNEVDCFPQGLSLSDFKCDMPQWIFFPIYSIFRFLSEYRCISASESTNGLNVRGTQPLFSVKYLFGEANIS